MTTARSYPNYRDSCTPWAPRIPEHWKTARLRYVARVGNGTTPARDRLDYWIGGTVPWLASGQVNDYLVREARERITPLALKESSLQMLPAGSVILGMVGQGKTRGTAAYLTIDATINQNLAGITPGRELGGRYLHYTFIAAYNFQRNYGRGGNQAALNCAIVGSFPSLLPPRAEQDQIVAYLRAQDAHIARLIKAKRELIGLMAEQKTVIIHDAITRGIDPKVNLKKPSFEWVDEIPVHWDELPLKHVSKLNNSGSYGVNPEDGEAVLPVATTAQISQEGRFLVEKMPRRGFTRSESSKYETKPGDILVVKSSGSIFNVISGKAGIVREDTPKFVFSNFLLRLIPDRSRIYPEYLFLLLGGHLTRERVKQMVAGTTFPNLQVGEYRSAVLPVPPLEEQSRILSSISERTEPLDALIGRARIEIELILEYRDRQIADVVTGQVDVRGWVPGPDDVVADEDLAVLGGDEELDTDGDQGDDEV